MDCIFCRIASGEIPARFVYEDDEAVAFSDLNPQAPTHILVIPKAHIVSLAEAGEADRGLLGHLALVAAQVADQHGLDAGYRVVSNVGPDGGQSVEHLHLHVLGGRAMGWPPG